MDIQRTIGWFTIVYPVLLKISHENSLDRQIKEIKETLRRVPKKGMGYEMLKYLTAKKYKKDMAFNLKPQVSFNYMGQFDADLKQTAFELAAESVGQNHSLSSRREYDLDVLGMIINKQLEISITYSKKQFKKGTIETLCHHFQSHLTRVIYFCSERENKELTPSDFSYKNISLEQLDSIFD
jgi:non-ribosomal peptide synthase protein (TIGR01720 family)